MNMFKRGWIGGLSLALLLSLCACSSTQGGGASSALGESELQQGETIFSDRDIDVKDIKVFAGFAPNEWMKAAAQVYKQKYGGTVTFLTSTWDMRITRLQQYIQAGDSPDLASVYFYDGITLMSQDLLLPLDEYVTRDNPNYSWDLMDSMYSFGGRTYGMVARKEDMGPKFVLFNRALFKKNSVETPDVYYDKGEWNWEVFRKLAKDVTVRSGAKIESYGFACWMDEIFMLSNGVNPLAYDGAKIQLDLDGTAVREGLQLIFDMVNVDKSMLSDQFPTEDFFSSGKTAMYVGGIDDMKLAQDKGLDVDLVPFPQGPSADKLYNYCFPGGWSIPKGAKSINGGLAFAEIIANGFPSLDEKNKPKLTDAQQARYEDCNQNLVTTLANCDGPFKTEWLQFVQSIRTNTPVGTAVGANKGLIEKKADDLMKNQK